MSTADVPFRVTTWPHPGHRDSADRRELADGVLPMLFGVGTVLMDVAIIVGAFLLAYWLRFIVPDDSVSALGIEQYAVGGFLVGILTTASFGTHGFYDEDRPLLRLQRLRIIVSSVSTAIVLASALSFLLGDQRYSRIWLGAGAGFAVAGLSLWRSYAHAIYLAARDRFAPRNRVIIVGANEIGIQLARELAVTHPIIGFVDNGIDPALKSPINLLGPMSDLEHHVYSHGATLIVVALPSERQDQVRSVISRGFRRRVTIRIAPDLETPLHGRVDVEEFAGRPYIGFTPVAKVSWLKRGMDIVLGTLIVLGISPIIAGIALAIMVDSRGPVLYRQERVGRNGKHFMMYKFRSMRQDAETLLDTLRDRNEASGPLFKMRDDPRVTRIGRVLRRFSLDELPQLLNVLRGEMSLVGPRPPVPSEVARYDDWHLARLRAVPGMTGLWQASGRSEVPFHDMVRLDLHYIQNWSLSLDVEILIRTIPAVLTHRGAY
ncbi:MAG: sugar transferase [Chloroflexota bacterium]